MLHGTTRVCVVCMGDGAGAVKVTTYPAASPSSSQRCLLDTDTCQDPARRSPPETLCRSDCKCAPLSPLGYTRRRSETWKTRRPASTARALSSVRVTETRLCLGSSHSDLQLQPNPRRCRIGMSCLTLPSYCGGMARRPQRNEALQTRRARVRLPFGSERRSDTSPTKKKGLSMRA